MSIIFGMEVGPHVKQLSEETWYGSFGGCNICGCSKEGDLIPRAVRYWDPDDGWRSGVLCRYCIKHCGDRGPLESDYAFQPEILSKSKKIDAVYHLVDCDGAYTDTN